MSRAQATAAMDARLDSHHIMVMKRADPGLDNFKFDPEMFYDRSEFDVRKMRTEVRGRYVPPDNTILGAFHAIFHSDLRSATVFSSLRLFAVVLAHLIASATLAAVYSRVDIAGSERTDFLNGTKDFADLCVTGIVFLLGGFVTTMLTRWWAFRTQCCGGLHQACTNLCMYAASVWPTDSPEHREARRLVSRYSLAAYQLLFIEARAADLQKSTPKDQDGVTNAVGALVDSGTLSAEEVLVLQQMAVKSGVVISWLAAFWEKVLDPNSGLAASQFNRNCDNGRYSIIYGQLFAARNSISLCHMYMQTQLPYGYIHLILIVVHLTCVANTIFCGIHLGQMIKVTLEANDAPEVLIPLIFVRVMRIIFVPLLLDGMLLIGSIIAMPLGDDEDDFPAGAFLESMEDECLAPGAALEQLHPAYANNLTKKGEEKK